MFSSALAFFRKFHDQKPLLPNAKIQLERALSVSIAEDKLQLLLSKPEYERSYQLFPQDVLAILKLEAIFDALLEVIDKGHIELAEVEYINSANEKIAEVFLEMNSTKELLSKKTNFVEKLILPAFGSIQLTAEVDLLIQQLIQVWECKLETFNEIKDKISECLLMQHLERGEIKEEIAYEKQECKQRYAELIPLNVRPRLNDLGWLIPHMKLSKDEVKRRERQFYQCQSEIREKEEEMILAEKKLADFEKMLVYPEGGREVKEPSYQMGDISDCFYEKVICQSVGMRKP